MFINTSYPPKEWHRSIVIIVIGLLFTCCIAAEASDTSLSGNDIAGSGSAGITTAYAPGSLHSPMYSIPVQKFTQQQIAKKNSLYNAEMVYTGEPVFYYPESRNLLGHIDYIPEERNQNYLNNCWVWACTAALEAELDVQNGVKQRLSIQYFDSNYEGGSGSTWEYGMLGGGDPETFAEFYNGTGIAIPWSNQHAEYQDGPHHVTVNTLKRAYVDADEIQTDPYYGLESISVEKIQTRGVDTSTAIHNIKKSIHNDKPVILSLTFPNEETLDQFADVWYHQTESDPLDISSWSQEEINYTEKGAHEMLVVGYDGDDWIVLNSWPAGLWQGVKQDGTPFQQYIDRPHNLLRLKMDLDYSMAWPPASPCTEYMGCSDACDCTIYLTTWQVLNVTFANKTPLRPSLALDPHGKPHIAYFNQTGALLYASWVDTPVKESFFPMLKNLSRNGHQGTWNTVTVFSDGYPGSRYCSLAFDSKGNPHISFAAANGKNLKYASFVPAESGGIWNVETVSHSTDGIGENSLVITGNSPAISYYDYSTRSLNYATKVAGGWHTGVVDGESDVGGGNSLKIGIPGMPYISYTDYSRGALRFARPGDPSLSIPVFSDDSQYGIFPGYSQYVFRFGQFMTPFHQSTGPDWFITTVDGFDSTTPIPTSTYAGKYTSLALDSQGRPVITYYAEGTQNIRYASWDGEDWELQNPVWLTTDGVAGSFSSLAMGKGADTGFSMYDENNKDLIYSVKRHTTGGITTPQPWLDFPMEKVDVPGDEGRYNSLALSSANIPYIAYYDATNGAVKCAWKEESPWSVWSVVRRGLGWKITTVGG